MDNTTKISTKNKTIRLTLVDDHTHLEEAVTIPSKCLTELSDVIFKNISNINDAKNIAKTVPKIPGCYWIASNEPCYHCFNGRNTPPIEISTCNNVLYNGVTTDLNKRLKDHLLRSDSSGSFGSVSGISFDLLDFDIHSTKPRTHVKHLFTSTSDKKKLPKILNESNQKYEIITDKESLINCMKGITYFEKKNIRDNHTSYFKNGICVSDRKHSKYKWSFIYMPIDNELIRSHIEIQWRDLYGVPPLASYISGR
tara:strand:+ start:2006 stop:2767 length:762 start_codon:yes stop_codon:yes gene_type:complete